MRWWRRIQREQDLERELRDHLDVEAEEQEENGLTQEEASDAARRALGNATRVKEDTREVWGWGSVERIAQDLRYALRVLRGNSAFAIAALLTLTLGIGANSAIFSLVNAVLLRPLPFRDPGRLVSFWSENRQLGFSRPAAVCDPDFLKWRQQSRSFSEIAAFQAQTSNLTGSGTPERLLGSTVTVNLFHLLGRQPALGRAFLPEEATAGRDNVILLNQRLWARYFHSDRSIVGRSITLDDRAFTVVGVMPEDFQFPNQADFWIPSTLSGNCSNASNQVLARLQPGASQEQAQREVAIVAHRLARESHHDDHGWKTRLVSLQNQMSAKLRPTLLLLLCAVGLVLLIACANVANLLLARSTARQHEMATRRALGASGGRIVRQLLAESLCLALVAGSLGLFLSFLARNVLLSLLPSISNQPGFLGPLVNNAIDLRVLGFVLLSSVGAGILFGLAPALESSGMSLLPALKGSRAMPSSASRMPNPRNAFIVAEVALTLVLLVAAGLLARSFIRLRTRLLDSRQYIEPGQHGIVKVYPFGLVAAPGFRQLERSRENSIRRETWIDRLISQSVSEARTNALAVGSFAGLALILAMIGIYGVIAYSVTQRTREIGIRVALGATRAQVLTSVVRQGLALTLIGVVLGLLASLAVTRLLASRLYEIRATDPETFLIVVLLLVAISTLASYLAARHAARLDPMASLRYE